MAAQLSGIGRIVSETKGLKTENEYHSAAWDHGLYKPFKPASLPGTLTYTGAMYNSTDQGATWEKAHSFEAKKQRAQHIQTVKEQLDCATNIVCGEDTIDGIVYDTCITQCMTNTGSIAKPVTSSSRQCYPSRENRKPSRRTNSLIGERGRGAVAARQSTLVRPFAVPPSGALITLSRGALVFQAVFAPLVNKPRALPVCAPQSAVRIPRSRCRK